MRYLATALVAALLGAAAVYYVWLGPSRDEAARLGTARDALSAEVKALNERLRALESDRQALEKKGAELAGELDRTRSSLAEKDQALATARTESASLAQKLAGVDAKAAAAAAKAAAAAAERDKLARRLEATGKGLDEAKARSAELNKSYEALLKEQKQLTAVDAARAAELERIKKAFEEAQSEVARLTGARGIYTVQDGDHLSKIAAFFYRDALRWHDIFRANAFLISSPDLIYPRQVLIIPH